MSFIDKAKNILSVVSTASKSQVALLSVTGIVAFGGLGIGGFKIYENFWESEKPVNIESETELNTETELEAESVTETEIETETETEIETETETEQPDVLVKLSGTSIEKDLKIKIQNESKSNIKPELFTA